MLPRQASELSIGLITDGSDHSYKTCTDDIDTTAHFGNLAAQ